MSELLYLTIRNGDIVRKWTIRRHARNRRMLVMATLGKLSEGCVIQSAVFLGPDAKRQVTAVRNNICARRGVAYLNLGLSMHAAQALHVCLGAYLAEVLQKGGSHD